VRQAELKSAPNMDPPATPHVETARSAYSVEVMRADAKQALQQLGFKPPVSRNCVDWALASQPPPTTLEQLIRVALRYSR
jgi:Holliday junction resolvasome RuvABC DNA-binding subunit